MRAKKGVIGLKGNWEPLSSSLRMQSQAELRSLMPVMGSTRCAVWKCYELCSTAGRRGQGSRSIAIVIGSNFYSTRREGRQLQS